MSDSPLSLQEQIDRLQLSIDAACEEMDRLRAENAELKEELRSRILEIHQGDL